MTASAIRPSSQHRGPLTTAAHALLLDGLVAPFARAVAQPRLAVWDVDPGSLRGPLVIVANHASHLDTPLILATLPPWLRHRTAPAAAEDYFYRRPLQGAAVTALVGAFPFPRSGAEGLDRAATLLSAGWSVLLFPEGTRSDDGRLHRFRDGVGRLLAHAGVPALPIALSGTFDCWPRTRATPRRGPVAVHVGAPWTPPADAHPCAIASALEQQVDGLLLPVASPERSQTRAQLAPT